jgi:Epoxide hydrolase N terminus
LIVSDIRIAPRFGGAAFAASSSRLAPSTRLKAGEWVDDVAGVQFAKLRELVRYWGKEYDWRKGEAKLNAFPQFKTRIDGVRSSSRSSSSVRSPTRRSTAAGRRTPSTS